MRLCDTCGRPWRKETAVQRRDRCEGCRQTLIALQAAGRLGVDVELVEGQPWRLRAVHPWRAGERVWLGSSTDVEFWLRDREIGDREAPGYVR